MGVRFSMFAVDPERLLDVLTDDEVLDAREESLAFLLALIRATGSPKSRRIVQPLLNGHRRWWVGSFVESLRRSRWHLNTDDVAYAEGLLSLMLGKFNCGAAIRAVSPSATRAAFPISPGSEADCHMAVFSAIDFEFLRLFFAERLGDEDRRFARPTSSVGIAPGNDDDWDAWVREVIQSIATRSLDVPDPSLVSFLG